MKYLIVLLIAIGSIGATATLQAQSTTADKFTVKVDGLGCPFCAYGLEKKFKELKGIKNIKIEMEEGMMYFDYPSEENLSIQQIEKQVEKAGYTPVNIVVERANGERETSENNTSGVTDTIETKEIKFFVAGNCDMCKARIEKAANNTTGVSFANWDKETQQITVKLTDNTKQSVVETAIARVGHDTKNKKADKETYKNLPGCCQYNRNK